MKTWIVQQQNRMPVKIKADRIDTSDSTYLKLLDEKSGCVAAFPIAGVTGIWQADLVEDDH